MIPDISQEALVWIIFGAAAYLWFFLVFAFIIMLELVSIAKTLKHMLTVMYSSMYGEDSMMPKYMKKLRKKMGEKEER